MPSFDSKYFIFGILNRNRFKPAPAREKESIFFRMRDILFIFQSVYPAFVTFDFFGQVYYYYIYQKRSLELKDYSAVG